MVSVQDIMIELISETHLALFFACKETKIEALVSGGHFTLPNFL